MSFIHTLGDSILDNLYWVNLNKDHTVEGKLQKRCGKEHTVVSHAYDGFTSSDLLTGGTIGQVLHCNAGYLDGLPGHKRKRLCATIRTAKGEYCQSP